MARLAVQVIGYMFLALGIIGMLTPIPLGLVFFVLALLFLIPTSPRVTRAVHRLRARSARLDRALTTLIRKLPSPYRRILRRTDVDPLERSHGW